MKDKIKYVEQQAKFRKAQTELRENGLENTPTTTKREIMRALDKEMDDHELMIFKRFLARMNYFGSCFGLTTAAILPKKFRFYQKLSLASRVAVCVSTFLITQNGVTFKYLCDEDSFEVDFQKSKKVNFQNII